MEQPPCLRFRTSFYFTGISGPRRFGFKAQGRHYHARVLITWLANRASQTSVCVWSYNVLPYYFTNLLTYDHTPRFGSPFDSILWTTLTLEMRSDLILANQRILYQYVNSVKCLRLFDWITHGYRNPFFHYVVLCQLCVSTTLEYSPVVVLQVCAKGWTSANLVLKQTFTIPDRVDHALN